MAEEHTLNGFGSRVKQLREEQRLSQRELADRAATTQQTISRIEAGRIWPTHGLLTRVAGALGVPPAALLEAPERVA